MSNNLNITITGDTSSGRQLAANVIADALEEAGFDDVNLSNHLDEPVERQDTATLLDLMAQNRPGFFNTEVSVRTRPAIGEVDELTTGSEINEASDEMPMDTPELLPEPDL